MPAQVLLIDDNEKFSNTIQVSFTMNGITLERAATWEEGVSKFRTGLHELVIADYNLPGSPHGLQLLAEIKPLRPSSELILISGAITSVPEDKIKISGLVDDYIPKTARLAKVLLERARIAIERADTHSDWNAIAQAHISGSEVDKAKLEEIDKLLRQDVDNKG